MNIKSNGMFHTYKTMDELQDYFEKFNGTEKQMLYMGAMLMMNHLSHIQKESE